MSDPFEQRVYFNETKVLKHGIYSEWCNHGSLSDDTRILSGSGRSSYGGCGNYKSVGRLA